MTPQSRGIFFKVKTKFFRVRDISIFIFIFWLYHTDYGLLVSLPRIEPGPPATKVLSPKFPGLPQNSQIVGNIIKGLCDLEMVKFILSIKKKGKTGDSDGKEFACNAGDPR